MKSLITILVVLCALAAVSLGADTPKNVTVTEGTTGILDSSLAAQNVSAEGGNITDVDLETNSSTSNWQAFVGSISGNLQLGRGSDVLVDFGALAETEFDTVFATQNTNFDWANLAAGTASDVDAMFGFGAGIDNATSTYDTTGTFDGIGSCPSRTLGSFSTGVLHDGAAVAAKTDLAFAASVGEATGFDGNTYDYEMLVPTNSTTDDYFLYLSLA